eukprot:5209487-Pleurochrysis_carterae.AAC.1
MQTQQAVCGGKGSVASAEPWPEDQPDAATALLATGLQEGARDLMHSNVVYTSSFPRRPISETQIQ